MTTSTISSKGQITVPVELRRKLGIKPHDRLTMEPVGDSIVIKRAPSLLDLKGFLGKALPPDEEQRLMEQAVADHVLGRD